MLKADPLVERFIASALIAFTAVLLFLIAIQFVEARFAWLIALVFAFATSAWSVASRVLWQHGPSMLVTTAIIYIFVVHKEKPWAIGISGAIVAIRPTNSTLVVAVTLLVLFHYRRSLFSYLLCAMPVAIIFLTYTYSVYHRLQSSYYSLRPQPPHSVAAFMAVGQNLAGTLISPSRGLFFFTPILLFSLLGIYLAVHTRGQMPLSWYLIANALVQLIAVSSFGFWYGGWSYGPRLLSDLIPTLTFFLIPVVIWWRKLPPSVSRNGLVIAAGLALAFSVFVHGRGALSEELHRWNYVPASPPLELRLWDWSDPPFMRGITRHYR
jgi:hypothetical protein